jgi:UDP-N-acetylmuramyl pentapeptide phosphotransferase/UDP-N-acetylglucosamine-1-phosphate transferase
VNPLLILAYSSITFLVAILAFPLLIKLLHRWELLDHPADHKIHSEFTPSMGGICILLAVVIALLFRCRSGAGSAIFLSRWQ